MDDASAMWDNWPIGSWHNFQLCFYTPYTNIKTSAQNEPKCTIARQKIYREGHSPLPRPLPYWEGDTPSPYPTPSGVSILAPSALSVPITFHLRLQHWHSLATGASFLNQEAFLTPTNNVTKLKANSTNLLIRQQKLTFNPANFCLNNSNVVIELWKLMADSGQVWGNRTKLCQCITQLASHLYLRAVGRKVLWSSACVCLCVCAHCVCLQDISRTGSWITTKFGGWDQGVNL